MQKEADQQILQHLWDNLASRSSNIETLTIRDMVPRLHGLLPDPSEDTPEEAVMKYLQDMTRRNDGEYEMADGTRVRIVQASRSDWRPGDLGFRLEHISQ